MHSEAELDAALAAIDHKLHHETVPLVIEKKLIADHKKLAQQRERVWLLTHCFTAALSAGLYAVACEAAFREPREALTTL